MEPLPGRLREKEEQPVTGSHLPSGTTQREGQQPSIGRIVHYVSYGTPGGEYTSRCRAAVVTDVRNGKIDLCVLNPTGLFFNRDVRHADLVPNTAMHPGGTWHWPERV
jgi:hypothetical protein